MTSRWPALAGSIALLWSHHAFGQCTKDTDCRGDRICQQGTCVSQAPAPPPVAEPAPRPAGGGGEAGAGTQRLALKVHPLITLGGLLSGVAGGATLFVVQGELEYALAPNFSLLGTLAPLMATSQFGGGLFPGAVVGAGGRFYPFAAALRGFWLGGLVSAFYLTSLTFDLQAQAGYAWVFDNGFYISVGGSLSFAAFYALANGVGIIPIGILVPIGITF